MQYKSITASCCESVCDEGVGLTVRALSESPALRSSCPQLPAFQTNKLFIASKEDEMQLLLLKHAESHTECLRRPMLWCHWTKQQRATSN